MFEIEFTEKGFLYDTLPSGYLQTRSHMSPCSGAYIKAQIYRHLIGDKDIPKFLINKTHLKIRVISHAEDDSVVIIEVNDGEAVRHITIPHGFAVALLYYFIHSYADVLEKLENSKSAKRDVETIKIEMPPQTEEPKNDKEVEKLFYKALSGRIVDASELEKMDNKCPVFSINVLLPSYLKYKGLGYSEIDTLRMCCVELSNLFNDKDSKSFP